MLAEGGTVQHQTVREAGEELGVRKASGYKHLRLLRPEEEGPPEPGAPKSVSWDELSWDEDPWAQAFRNRNPRGATLREVGAALGISVSGARVIERIALLKLELAGGDALKSFLGGDENLWDSMVRAAR